MQAGDRAAADELLPLVYQQLRATAGSYFRDQHADHTLQPTALVHEAFVKLAKSSMDSWESRGHFCAVAAKAMRQILHDHAKAKRAAKRRSDGSREPLTAVEAPSGDQPAELLALDEALEALAEIAARGAEVVQLRFFGGLTNSEIARHLGVSAPTVDRDWRRCRAWMRTRLLEHSE